MKEVIKSTTIIGIRKDNLVVVAGDGQASFGNTVMKANVKKIRRLGQDNSVISGFAEFSSVCKLLKVFDTSFNKLFFQLINFNLKYSFILAFMNFSF